MSSCTLCDLVARTIPVSVAYEDSTIFAFMDIKPVNYGHVVIIPKRHIVYLAELDEDTGAELFKVTMRVAQAVRRSDVKCEAVNLFLADGEAAGQEEFHVHMHVIPRYKDDAFTLQVDYPTTPTREDLDRIAERISSLTS
ncbi:MAG: HIT family protein [Chloroflexota bacterium]|nr:MAG: HIT family protein [Chloroflexota bacterium]